LMSDAWQHGGAKDYSRHVDFLFRRSSCVEETGFGGRSSRQPGSNTVTMENYDEISCNS
jgi:hypothetical protein